MPEGGQDRSRRSRCLRLRRRPTSRHPCRRMGLEHGQHQHTWRRLFFTFFMFFTFFTLVERQFICGRGCSRHARGWWLGWAVRRKRRMLRHAAPSSAAVAVAISCDAAVSRAVPAAIVSELDWRAIAPATRTSMSICASLACGSP